MGRKERELVINKKRVLEIYGGRCANWEDNRFKHGKARPTIHHIIFKKDGGTNEKSNLIPLCKSCHRFVHFLADENERARNSNTRTNK